VGLHPGFPDIAPSARLLASFNEFFAGINGQKYKLGSRARLDEFVDRVDAVHYRHGDINDNNVRIEPLGLGYKRNTIARRADEFKMRPQESDFGFQEFEMVIGQEYAWAKQDSPPSKVIMHSRSAR
jgi:hypothetical protein